MPAAPYSIERVDLTTLTGDVPREIVPRGRQISSVTALVLAQGSSFKLHFGDGPGAPVVVQGVQFRRHPKRDEAGRCSYPDDGLRVTVEKTSAEPAFLLVTYSEEGLIEVLGGGSPALPAEQKMANGAIMQGQPGSLNDTPTVWLENPVGSGVLLRVRRVRAWASVAVISLVKVSHVVSGTVSNTNGLTRWMDGREAGIPKGLVKGTGFADATTRALLGADVAAGVINQATAGPMGELVTGADGDRWQLPPGQSILLRTATNGAGVTLWPVFQWEEI